MLWKFALCYESLNYDLCSYCDSAFRSFLGSGLPAQWPSCTRIAEALCIKLCSLNKKMKKKETLTQWQTVVEQYMCISQALLNNAVIQERTSLVLPPISVMTLRQW